jgi:signal transduction histidine kinase
MLAKETGLTADGRERLELLQAELARMAGMLTSHLAAAAPVLLDVAELVRVVCRAPAGPTAAPVELSVEPVPLVLGDGDQLTRLVANLVTNAQSAAGTRGRVRVHVGSCEGAASIAVEDSGGDTTSGSSCGFGLGLLIVDAVLRRHGGSSTCTASDLGGLRVAVTIPAGRPQQDRGVAR